jgi:hypothetical protein
MLPLTMNTFLKSLLLIKTIIHRINTLILKTSSKQWMKEVHLSRVDQVLITSTNHWRQRRVYHLRLKEALIICLIGSIAMTFKRVARDLIWCCSLTVTLVTLRKFLLSKAFKSYRSQAKSWASNKAPASQWTNKSWKSPVSLRKTKTLLSKPLDQNQTTVSVVAWNRFKEAPSVPPASDHWAPASQACSTTLSTSKIRIQA